MFKNEVENQLEKTINALRSDRGGEYIIVQQLTPPYTPQHNRVSERRNRTLLDMVRSMMNPTTLPLSFWDYALEAAACILNMVSTKKRDTPDKLQQRSVKCIFIGYLKETMGYYFYFPPENKIVVARYAEFFEKNLLSQEVNKRAGDLKEIQNKDTSPSEITSKIPIEVEGFEPRQEEEALVRRFERPKYAEFFEKKLLSQEVNGRAGDLEEIQNEDTSPSEITSKIPMEVEGFEPPQEEEALVRRFERPHRALDRLCLNVEVEEYSLEDLNEPANYKAAMLDLESNKWLDAMNAEMESMKDNQVWRLIDFPPNGKTVGSKLLFKKKTDMDDNVHTYKARLIAKGFTQTYGVDYEETFSPVADIRAIRILTAIAAFYNYEICQMDEASRRWNKRFDEEIKKFRFTQNLDEPCIYQKASGINVTFLILYVDDIIIMGNHIPSLQSVKTYLGKCFVMKELGKVTFILEIKIYRDRSRRLIGLCQSAYMDKILKRYRMDNSKRGYILMQERLDLNKTQGASTPREVKRMQNVPYALANPSELHWTAVKTIFKYLRNTKDMFLVYGVNPEAKLRAECYCDAGFETDRDDTKSQTGDVFALNGGAVD
uniref:Uncharacterized protein n=1 Tax=Tanacetum cinerariifolium TaxID=118510 RepID=A0A699JJY6_TANCI|nr:hypothetical protein [Tanacetum cinerariifolium]